MNIFDEYYDWLLEGSRRSARVVVPIVMELVRPKRVVDVGCGFGTWLAIFRDQGPKKFWASTANTSISSASRSRRTSFSFAISVAQRPSNVASISPCL
jgi:SAM-dependent methyltransferase